MNLTPEQRAVAEHPRGAFVEACPGSGKTRAIVARVGRIAGTLPANRGVSVLSFTNSAIDEFAARCREHGLEPTLRFPNFVSTFDGFLRHFLFAPGGVEGVVHKPVVVDSWDSLGIEIRLRGANALAGPGVSLDRFSAEDNRIDPASIGMPPLREHVTRHQGEYQRVAAARRARLRQRGYFSAADVRAEVVRRLLHNGWAASMGRALAARFAEVIVDEGQDCNPLDCRIIDWLRAARIPVTIVADPDQAIYGFRHGTPADLRAVASGYSPDDRLPLTGNFRSGPSICAIAATLRQRVTPDTSMDEAAHFLEPVHVAAYPGRFVTNAIGAFFLERLREAGVAPSNSLVLAHARRVALRACGSGADEDAGDSKVARVAAAVGAMWTSTSRGRERALSAVEEIILDLMGSIDEGEHVRRAVERHGIDSRWLRRSALNLLTALPRTCEDTDAARAEWVELLRQQVRSLRLAYREGVSERRYFSSRAGASWHRCLNAGPVASLRAATVHEAKGKQYDAICVVIPPDAQGSPRTDQLVRSWETRLDDEAKRVVYVGLTRARRLAVLALPHAVRDRVAAVLTAAGAHYRMHQI